MTRKELAALIDTNYGDSMVSSAVQQAAKEMPSIAEKFTHNLHIQSSFTKEEILFICTFIRPKLNPVQIALIEDNYIEHDTHFIKEKRKIYISGTEKYLEKLRKSPKFQSCANCIYLKGKSIRSGTTKLVPFCSFYNRYIHMIKIELKNRTRQADIFKDKCQTYRHGEVKLFYRKGY